MTDRMGFRWTAESTLRPASAGELPERGSGSSSPAVSLGAWLEAGGKIGLAVFDREARQ